MPTGSCEIHFGHLETEGCDKLRLQDRKIPPMLTVKGSQRLSRGPLCSTVEHESLRDTKNSVVGSRYVAVSRATELERTQALLPPRPAQLHCRRELVLLGELALRGADSPGACYSGALDAHAQGPDDAKTAPDLADADSLGSVAPEEDTVVLPAPLEHVLLDETLPLDAKALWRLVMADAAFWAAFLEARQARGVVVDGWAHVKAGPKRARPGCPRAAVVGLLRCTSAGCAAQAALLRGGGRTMQAPHSLPAMA